VKQIAGRIDKPDCFFLCEVDRQLSGCLRIWHFFDRVVSLKCFAEEKAQRCRVRTDRSGALLPLVQQIKLILSNLVRPELVGWSLKMLRKTSNDIDVAGYGSL
jgi:hypothetical protein